MRVQGEHIRQLMSWRAYHGFLLALLLSSHSSISSAIQVDKLEEKELIHAYGWLQEKGDRISQIGAVEIGLSILDKHPKIEPFVQGIIEQIRDDDADDKQSRFHLLSALIVLVEGELSRTKILREKNPKLPKILLVISELDDFTLRNRKEITCTFWSFFSLSTSLKYSTVALLCYHILPCKKKK